MIKRYTLIGLNIILIFLVSNLLIISSNHKYTYSYFEIKDPNLETKVHIKLNKLLKLNNRNWSFKTRNEFVKLLILINKNYLITPNEMLALIWQESQFKIEARSRINSDGSRDYGLTQQNSFYANHRIKAAHKKLAEWKIKANRSAFDPLTNTLSGAMYLSSLLRINSDDEFYIKAYNVGIRGTRTKKQKAKKYFKEFSEKYEVVKSL